MFIIKKKFQHTYTKKGYQVKSSPERHWWASETRHSHECGTNFLMPIQVFTNLFKKKTKKKLFFKNCFLNICKCMRDKVKSGGVLVNALGSPGSTIITNYMTNTKFIRYTTLEAIISFCGKTFRKKKKKKSLRRCSIVLISL